MSGSASNSKVVAGNFHYYPEQETAAPLYQKVREPALTRQESAERLTEDLGIIFCALDREGRITYYNRAWVEFYERNGNPELYKMPTLGDRLADPSLIDEGSEWQQVCRAVREGLQSYWEDVMPCHAPNQPRWMLERVQRCGDELVLSMYFLRDHTEEKPAQARVRCLFTDREKAADWELSDHALNQTTTLGLSPECSLQVYQWLRGN